jgi:hypothetical protein
MTKEELIKQIQEGLKTEESAITIYAKHLSAIISRSGLPESSISQIKKTLGILMTANVKHKELLNSLMKRVQRESIDVY